MGSCTGCKFLTPINNNDKSMSYICTNFPPSHISIVGGRPTHDICGMKPKKLNDVSQETPTIGNN